MDIVIEEIANSEDVAAMLEVGKQVFEYEMGITLPQDSADGPISHWLARTKQSREAVGTLSVVDTSGREDFSRAHRDRAHPRCSARAAAQASIDPTAALPHFLTVVV